MSAAIAAALKEIALILAKEGSADKRLWNAVLSIIAGVIFVIVLAFGGIFSLFSVSTRQNIDLINLIFKPKLPIDRLLSDQPRYYYHILEARKHLTIIMEETEIINAKFNENKAEKELEGVNILRAQVIYYVLFLRDGADVLPPPREEFAACFYNGEKENIIIINEETTIFSNLETLIGRIITDDEKNQIAAILAKLNNNFVFVNYDGEFCPPIEAAYSSSVSSPYGYRPDPFTGKTDFHNGVDFSWDGCFGAYVYAVSDGIVTRAGDVNDGYGKCVVLDHGNKISTYYAHCSDIPVSVGESVIKGQYIAQIGSTGRSAGPHLHFGLKVNGSWQDPFSLYR